VVLDSGSQKILNNLKKGITVEQIKKAAELTRKFGFNLNYFIIVGSPGETDDTIRETMKLIEETKPTAIFTYIMQLTPGTEIYEIAKQNNFISDIEWANKRDETIFYSKERDIEELSRYVQLINELFSFLKGKSTYSEGELKEIVKDVKGIQDIINLAHIKMGYKEFDNAKKILDEAIKFNSGSSEALMNKAVLLAMENNEKCIDFFNKAITADPENLLAYKNLGLFLFRQKRYNEAIDVFKTSVEIEPANIEFYNNLGSVYGTLEKYDEAINVFEKALLIDPSNKGTLRNLALTYEQKGEMEKTRDIRKNLFAI